MSIAYLDGEKDLQNSEMNAGSTQEPSTFEEEEKTTYEASTGQEAGTINDPSTLASGEEAEYPEGLSFFLIILALFLSVFVTALDQVWCISTIRQMFF
jgi:hypothetical protein